MYFCTINLLALQIVPFIQESDKVAVDSTYNVESIFHNHHLKASLELLERDNFITNFVTIIWILAFVILLSTIVINRKTIANMFVSLISTAAFNKMLRNKSNKLLMPLTATFLLIGSMMFTEIIMNNFKEINASYIVVFTVTLLTLLTYISIKQILSLLLFSLSNDTISARQFIKNHLSFNAFFATVLFLVQLLIFLNLLNVEILLNKTTAIVILVVLMYRFIRAFLVVFPKSKNLYFHIFLYLCTLEIVYPAFLTVLFNKILTIYG